MMMDVVCQECSSTITCTLDGQEIVVVFIYIYIFIAKNNYIYIFLWPRNDTCLFDRKRGPLLGPWTGAAHR